MADFAKPDFEIKSGDTFPFIAGFLTDLYGLVDVSAPGTVVILHLRTEDKTLLITGTCMTMTIQAGIDAKLIPSTNTSKEPAVAWTASELATVAAWRYEWANLDTNLPSNYEGEIQVTWASGRRQSFPNRKADNFATVFWDDLDPPVVA